MELLIKTFPHFDGLELPKYETAGSAGLDLRAAIPADQPIELRPFQRVAVPTGLAVEIPIGCEGQIRPRSGLSLREGLTAILGTIDSDFRNEMKVIVYNIDPEKPVVIKRGDRIAQLVISAYAYVSLKPVTELTETSRKGGFGSTGV